MDSKFIAFLRCDVIISLLFVNLPTSLNTASTIRMTVSPKTYVLTPLSNVHLVCEFIANEFNLFDNPPVWRKKQMAEDSQVNMMGNLVEPFASTRRHKATYTSEPPVHTFGLMITNVTQEDSGNYSCDVTGPHNAIIASVEHQIYVLSEVLRLLLYTNNETNPTQLPSQQPLVFIESQPGVIKCTAVGGYPPPSIEIILGNEAGNRSTEKALMLSYHVSLSGSRGLRMMQYLTEGALWRDILYPEDDDKQVQCLASVSGLETKETRTNIVLHCGAVIRCEEREADINERNVHLGCVVRVRPKYSHLFWVIDQNGTTVSEGEVVNEHWMLIQDMAEDVYETQLFIRLVSHQSFRTYTLHVDNLIAHRQFQITLKPKLLADKENKIQSNQQLSINVALPNKSKAEHQSLISDHKSHSLFNSGLTHVSQLALLSKHMVLILIIMLVYSVGEGN